MAGGRLSRDASLDLPPPPHRLLVLVGRIEPLKGIDALIGAIAETDDADRREDLRRAVVGVLDDLGVEHPLARESRRKLAGALY